MIVKDLIQFLSDFDENMEVGMRSTCGMVDLIVEVSRKRIKPDKDIVLLTGDILDWIKREQL